MNMAIRNWIGLAGLVAIAAAFSMAGCGGSKDEGDDAVGGTSAGGSGNSGGISSSSGGVSSGSGGATATAGSSTGAPSTGAYETDANGGYVCRKGVPADAVIAPGTSGTWGAAGSVAGGTFTYQDVDANKATLDTATTAGSVGVTGTVAVNGYTGFGIYFKDPEKCWNVAAYTGGVRMTLGGSIGGGTLAFQVQTNTNYPVDTKNNKGACIGTWGKPCNNNTYTIATVPATPTAIDIPWSSILGGGPVATVDTTQLLGIQWQINCTGSADCAVNLTISAVEFY